MKKLLTLILVLQFGCAYAQNYACIQAGFKHFFTNGNGYVRAIKVDSVRYSGDTVIYYPFKSPRGFFNYYYDTAGYHFIDSSVKRGCWLGEKVKQLPDGTFLFDSYWNDSVVIKTQAHLGDSWTFYKDSMGLNYRATIVSEDTAVILSEPDSIKTIELFAFHDSLPLSTDSFNHSIIILSKNHGFTQVMDLYMFPYHRPDTSSGSNYDYIMMLPTLPYTYYRPDNVNTYALSQFNATFNLVGMQIPNDSVLYQWSAGDVYEWSEEDYFDWMSMTDYSWNFYSDSVTFGVASLGRMSYGLWVRDSFYDHDYPPSISGLHYTDLTFYSVNYSIVDTGFVPEDYLLYSSNYNPDILYYFPDDSSYCRRGPLFHKLYRGIHDSVYKVGVGLVQYFFYNSDPLDSVSHELNMFYIRNGARTCGAENFLNTPLLYTPDVSISVKPNPTNGICDVIAPVIIENADIYDDVGRLLLHLSPKTVSFEISLASLPPGLYFLKMNELYVRKIVKL